MGKEHLNKQHTPQREENISPVLVSRVQSRLPVGTVSRLQPKMFTGLTRNELEPETMHASSTTQLPEEVQAKMENSFGQDFSGVSIHKDSVSAKDINAKAYTQGTDIHFAPGEYNPNSKEGQELLGHELTHVVQQGQGKVGSGEINGKGLEINQDAALEKEADEMGKKAAEGMDIQISKLSGFSIQKKGNSIAATKKNEHGDSRTTSGFTEYWDAEFDNGKSQAKGAWIKLDHTNSQIVSDFITKHYGVRPRELERFWFDNSDLRKNLSLQGDPILNYTIFVMEGGGNAITDLGINHNDPKNPISSYGYLGLDFVASEYPNLIKGNFLPSNFEQKYGLKIAGTANEKFKNIAFYDYPNFESASQAMGAYVNYSTSKIIEIGKQLGIKAPSNDELIFWTYLYFNNPRDWGDKLKLSQKGSYELSKWTFNDKKNADKKVQNGQALEINIDTMALMRISTYKYFKIRFNDKARYK
jgi:hypothetical protein